MRHMLQELPLNTMRSVVWFATCSALWLAAVPLSAAEPPAFFRGINLNGPELVIDGRSWEGGDSKNFECRDKSFEKQDVSLIPATDAARATMIRSSRWGGNRVELRNLPAGPLTLFLYLWEDNNSETFSIALNDKTVQAKVISGQTGHWQRLGPWFAEARDGRIVLTSKGGAANFSGIEIWTGHYDGLAEPPLSEEQLAFFENRIRPLLAQHCYECHSSGSEDLQAGLLVDSRPTLRRGGDTGPAIVPGDVERSLLIQSVRYVGDLQMPPEGKLSDREIADLERWVAMGAPDPRKDATRFVRKKFNLDEARKFWSLRPVTNPKIPSIRDTRWPRNDIDHFILAKLEQKQLQPTGDADRTMLIRRATYDLTGLPPSPVEVADFLNDDSSQAFARVVDRLLASPHYGERWGRHWMDLVRYADTAGDNSDYPVPQAYRYRNYIIDSLNADKPYDQFLREQIAGDLLPAADDAQRNEQLVATGYIAISRRFGSIVKDYPQHLTIEDTLDNIGRTVLGLTLTCARCHDHKFDPISQDDYYGLYGILESTQYPFPGIELDKKPRDFVALLGLEDGPDSLAYAVSEGAPGDAAVHLRGEPAKHGAVIPRRFLEVLGGDLLPTEAVDQSGRLQLAEWLTRPDNPLTARVMVNRLWQHHFGTGLVSTPSDFGTRGQPPTHPELLDWLAARFMADGWSLKSMHRLIMLSRTYQLSSRSSELPSAVATRNMAVDPTASLRWRFERQQLDAESLRDTLLLVSGELDTSMPREPHPFPPVDKWGFTQHHPFRDSYDSNHRTVYLMTARLNARPFFTTFDGADRNASTAIRDSSVTTVQSLYLMNDEFVHGRASAFAKRLIAEETEESQRLSRAFQLVMGRQPTLAEQTMAEGWLQHLTAQLTAEETPAGEREQAAWSALARVLFRTNEFLYLD